jgi:hypothetical protein
MRAGRPSDERVDLREMRHAFLTRSDVERAFRDLLNRAPESDQVIVDLLASHRSIHELVLTIVSSREFRYRVRRNSNHDLSIEHRILVGTHHKTGTQWLANIFSYVCEIFGLRYFKGDQNNLSDADQVFFQVDSAFNLPELTPYKGVHIIRDPRDVIISGAYFHETTTEEDWLFVPNPKFGGMSYREKICSLSSPKDKLCFEMDNKGQQTLLQMRGWDYDNPDFFEVTYESLVQDADLIIFDRMFRFLGFQGLSIATCLDIAWYRSLFSGQVPKDGVHVRMGTPEQWRNVFTKEIGEEFVARFGGLLRYLGYEHDDCWVEQLPSTRG